MDRMAIMAAICSARSNANLAAFVGQGRALSNGAVRISRKQAATSRVTTSE